MPRPAVSAELYEIKPIPHTSWLQFHFMQAAPDADDALIRASSGEVIEQRRGLTIRHHIQISRYTSARPRFRHVASPAIRIEAGHGECMPRRRYFTSRCDRSHRPTSVRKAIGDRPSKIKPYLEAEGCEPPSWIEACHARPSGIEGKYKLSMASNASESDS